MFIGQAGVEAEWAIVDRDLQARCQALKYRPGSWGPKRADALLIRGTRLLSGAFPKR